MLEGRDCAKAPRRRTFTFVVELLLSYCLELLYTFVVLVLSPKAIDADLRVQRCSYCTSSGHVLSSPPEEPGLL